VVIPYVNCTSEAIRRVLTPLGIRTCFQPLTTLRNILTHVKDPVPPEEKTSVVYLVPCGDCHLCWQDWKDIDPLHKRALTTVNPMDSALAENALNTGHEISWSDARAIVVLYMTVQRLQAVLTYLLLMS